MPWYWFHLVVFHLKATIQTYPLNEVAKRQERQLGTPVRQYPTVEKTKNMANMVGLVYWKHNSAYAKGISTNRRIIIRRRRKICIIYTSSNIHIILCSVPCDIPTIYGWTLEYLIWRAKFCLLLLHNLCTTHLLRRSNCCTLNFAKRSIEGIVFLLQQVFLVLAKK